MVERIENEPVRIALITGYLGAGKTTLLNYVLANDRDMRVAVIVNDIGEVNIDASLIREGDLAQSDTVIPLTNGCICCTLSDDLADQLGGIAASGDFDYIVIEASGICEPMPIAYTISEFCKAGQPADEAAAHMDTGSATPTLALDNIVAVVDCARMIDEFSGGRDLLSDNLDEDDVESLLVQQLEFCTTVVLNKTDLVSPEQVDEVRAIVRSLQKDAAIVEAEHGVVPLEELVSTNRFDFDTVYQSAAWLDMLAHPEEHEEPETLEYGISTFIYERAKPFSIEAFTDFATNWPDTVIRTKGIAWVDQYPDSSFILEQAGQQRQFTDNGPWNAERGPYTQLVFIGRGMDRDAIETRLDACLTDL